MVPLQSRRLWQHVCVVQLFRSLVQLLLPPPVVAHGFLVPAKTWSPYLCSEVSCSEMLKIPSQNSGCCNACITLSKRTCRFPCQFVAFVSSCFLKQCTADVCQSKLTAVSVVYGSRSGSCFGSDVTGLSAPPTVAGGARLGRAETSALVLFSSKAVNRKPCGISTDAVRMPTTILIRAT